VGKGPGYPPQTMRTPAQSISAWQSMGERANSNQFAARPFATFGIDVSVDFGHRHVTTASVLLRL